MGGVKAQCGLGENEEKRHGCGSRKRGGDIGKKGTENIKAGGGGGGGG